MQADPSSKAPEPADSVLVTNTLAGEPTAFDELFRRYQQRVYAVVYNMTLNHADTHDLLMETFSKAYQNLHRYKGDAAFYTWIYRIAVNQTFNFLKRNKIRQHASLDDADVMDLDHRLELVDTSSAGSPDQPLHLSELQNKLNQALAKLSKDHRAVVTFSDIQGLSHQEIAKILNCSEGTVKSRLFYAHKQLQKLLREYR